MTPEEMKQIEPDENGHRYVQEKLRSQISNVQVELYISEHAEVGDDGQLKVTIDLTDPTDEDNGGIVTVYVMDNRKGKSVQLHLPSGFRAVSLETSYR